MLSTLTYVGQCRQLRAGRGATLAEIYFLPYENYFEAVAPPRFPTAERFAPRFPHGIVYQ